MAIYLLPVCVNSMDICLDNRGITYFFVLKAIKRILRK